MIIIIVILMTTIIVVVVIIIIIIINNTELNDQARMREEWHREIDTETKPREGRNIEAMEGGKQKL